ncbi:MAG TPA: hypothetical protein HA230_02815 [Candidatus Aenigmarchaeota archaeon]|nr:hypothetical protein [Candidatus Aenigmarchaeota archaeon]
MVDIKYIINLLKDYREDQIKVTNETRDKIENGHKISIKEVIGHLLNPESMKGFEEQEARREHQRTFMLVFKKSSQKKLCIVVTENLDTDTLFVVTAFESSKRIDRLIKKGRMRRA